MTTPALGALLHAFLADELPLQKGLRPASIKAYRDALRLFLAFVAADVPCRLTQITLDTLTLDRVLRFLHHLEVTRHNHRRTRNHRRTVVHAFFEFLARRVPECLAVAQQVAAIPVKRVPPPETRFLDRDVITTLFRQLPTEGRFALRDRAPLARALQHRGAGSRSRRSPCRASGSRRAAARALAWQRRQMARLSSVGSDRPTLGGTRQRRATECLTYAARLYLTERPGPHTVRHLQNRPSPHGPAARIGSWSRTPSHQPAPVSTFVRRTSARSRRRRQCDSRLAGPCQPRHDQSLCGDYRARQGGRASSLRALLRRTPPNACVAG
jgi:hypothetical protein